MKLTKKQLELKSALEKEWLITNGIGGFASSTVLGANTRRYHGLLVAPLKPPAKRYLILSKLDESLEIEGKKYDLFTNMCRNYLAEGYKYLETFEKNPLPEFTYKVEDVKIQKKVSFVYGKNTIVVKYTVKNNQTKSVKITIAPIMNFRDFHNMTTSHNFEVEQKFENAKVQIQIDQNIPIYMCCQEGNYREHQNDTFRNMYYLKEEERGFFAEEDLCVPGRYEIMIEPKEKKEITVIVSLEKDIENILADEVFEQEIQRLEQVVKQTRLIKNKKTELTKQEKDKNEFLRDLVIASDNFIVWREEERLHSILAGFPWFLDWGRDTAISFEGLLLITRRFDLAKEALLMLTKDICQGLVPNGYSESDNAPLYNSADSSLLLFEQVNHFMKYTRDYDFVKGNLYQKLKTIIENYQNGIELDGNHIYIDTDGLLSSGTPNIQNTWMDAKIGNFVVTPRNGKVVEINSLWYNALKTMEYLAKKFGEKELADTYKKVAKSHQKVFEEKFYCQDKKSLYDVLGDSKIRPNQLFSISTTYPIINPASFTGKTIWETAKKKLLTKCGLRTLAQDEQGYIAEYSGDCVKRDKSYHQGISWVWLLGLYEDALENIIDCEKDRIEKEKYIIEKEKFVEKIFTTFKKELYAPECFGSISEVYNSEGTAKPGGTFAQAWSVSEILKIVTRLEE